MAYGSFSISRIETLAGDHDSDKSIERVELTTLPLCQRSVEIRGDRVTQLLTRMGAMSLVYFVIKESIWLSFGVELRDLSAIDVEKITDDSN